MTWSQARVGHLILVKSQPSTPPPNPHLNTSCVISSAPLVTPQLLSPGPGPAPTRRAYVTSPLDGFWSSQTPRDEAESALLSLGLATSAGNIVLFSFIEIPGSQSQRLSHL